MRTDLFVSVVLLAAVVAEGSLHLLHLERARAWQASREASVAVERQILGEIHEARSAGTLPPPSATDFRSRLRAARAKLGERAAAAAPPTGARLVEVSGEPFLVVSLVDAPPAVLWWPGVEARAERLSGALLTVGEAHGDGAVPVLDGVLDGSPVWLTVPDSRVVPFRLMLAGLAVAWVGYELVRTLVARARERATKTARDALLQRLSHELRTPAAAVRSLAEALRSGAASGQEALFLARIEHEAVRLGAGIDHVLRAARDEEVLRPLDLQQVDLRALVERVVERWQPRLGAIGVGGKGTSVLSVDPARIEEALDALLDNAVIHGAPPVRVSVDSEAGFARVTVEDGGEGIPAHERDRVLRRGEGRDTGIGLWAASEVARAHRGRLELASGSRVTLCLPHTPRT